MAFAYDVIFMVGSQGSGKGTQGKRLAERLGFFYWDMGAVLRGIASQDTPLGKQVASIINPGHFLDDELLIGILKDNLPELSQGKGIIFDGVPRRMGQAHYLLERLHAEGRDRITTISIEVPRADCVARILERAKVEGRKDDTPEAINRRLDFFESVIRPMLDYLKTKTAYFEIDGRPAADEVEKEIDRALGL